MGNKLPRIRFFLPRNMINVFMKQNFLPKGTFSIDYLEDLSIINGIYL